MRSLNQITALTSMGPDPSYANAGQILPPFKTEQYEAGVKVDWGSLKSTLSVFRITQPSLLDKSGSPLPTQTVDGEQVNRGVELNLSGQLTPRLRLLGGAMLLDPKLRKTSNPVNNGKTAPGVPQFQGNLAAEWDAPFLQGLTITGRVTYTGSEYLREGALYYRLSDVTLFDSGLRYTFERANALPVTIRFNVNNMFNKSYWRFDGLSNCCLVASRPRVRTR
ncbi:TonB-dependent receptor [Sphingomonadaceae bacterium jetA1]|uniref:TonB-dependent receptor domain-containing protein n=1 Tax=Facivitalis istanbulensis TaxID=3075838 RepID=UPI0034824586